MIASPNYVTSEISQLRLVLITRPMPFKTTRSHRNISLAKGNIPSTISAPEFHKHDSQF